MTNIERYLNVRSAVGPDFGPEGERLSFRMDTTGTFQVWSLDQPGAWPEQHTFFEERVTSASWSPERPELIFGMDEGGNERAQLFRLEPATGDITPLTRRPEAKHRWGGWSHDGDQFAFTSNRRSDPVFDVYVQGRTETENDATLVHEGDGWLTVAGFSPDDDALLVVEAASSFDQDLHVLDLGDGTMTHVTPHEGDVRHLSPQWGPDGEGIYVATDRNSDTLQLERIDLDSHTYSVLDAAGEWNVDTVNIHEDSRRLVYTRNVDGYSDVTAGELTAANRIDEFPQPELPDGVAGGISFDPDGNRYAVTVTGSTVNPNVYVVESTTGAVTRWTQAATAGIPPESFVERELVHYPTFDGRKIPAFFSTPEAPAPDAGYPVIVDIHGGPESQRRPSFGAVAQFFLAEGYAVMEPNVRGSSGYGKTYSGLDDVEQRMDSVADIKAAVEWLHDHPEVDPARIVALGGSYGGFMVLASMTEYPDLWAAGIDIVGIANFVTFLENTGEWRRELREAEYGSLDSNREFLESISPITTIESIEAPLFVLHGENDPRVPVGEAEQIVEEARAQGVPVRKRIYEDEGHGFTKLENRIDAYSAIVDFLDTHV